VLCISAIEGFAFYSNKVNTIYTKQDAYRLLMTTAIFSIFYSLASLSTFHYKYAASLLFSFPLMVLAMRKFKQSEFKKSLIYMLSNLILVISIRILIKYS
jgi:1,4-dihydroxy-2-naphthoate octaprenyltransferase